MIQARFLFATIVASATTLLFAGCRASYHPLVAAEACRCSPNEYCHVRAAPPGGASATECLPFPAACGEKPACACLGRPIDACREELGAFTILEPRSVQRCRECSDEEYCFNLSGAPVCRVLPARCDDSPTCACLLEPAHGQTYRCEMRQGRIVMGAPAD